MSIITLYRDDSAIYLATDGLACEPVDTCIRSLVSKVFPLAHLNCFIGNTGAGGIAGAMVDIINTRAGTGAIQSFDDLRDNLVEIAQEAYRRVADGALFELGLAQSEEVMNSTVIVGGWSEREGKCIALKVSSYSKSYVAGPGEASATNAPWAPAEISAFYATTMPSGATQERFGLNGSHPAMDYLARMVCAARADCLPDANGVRPAAIGGYLQMLVIDRAKVMSWIAHRWPDEVGTYLDPTRGEPMPSFPIAIP